MEYRQIQKQKGLKLSNVSFRSRALDILVRRIWGSQNLSLADFKKNKDKLKRWSRGGEKWSLIRPKGLVLGIGGKSKL